MPSKAVHVRRKRGRRQHPWVFSNEVTQTQGGPQAGESVFVFERGLPIGSAIYSPNSLVRARLYSDKDEKLDMGLISRRMQEAWEYRQEWLPGEADFRLVHGESDRLPGLVIDKYGTHYVVQTYAAGMDMRLESIAEALVRTFDAECVYEKNDFRLRDTEGLERRQGILRGKLQPEVTIVENGVSYRVDIAGGQKTGHYFDQRRTRRRVRELARGRRVLDMFCYTGGFAISAALGGAREVTGVDSSARACSAAAANAEQNGVGGVCRFVVGEAFEYLKHEAQAGQEYDMVCLDPPSFAKSKREKAAGLKGYRSANVLAMRLLQPRGILVSCSCSHHVGWQDMTEMLGAAALEAGRGFTILDRVGQGPDHPILLAMPESEYLRCFVLRMG